MTARTTVHRLQVATPLLPLHRRPGAARHRRRAAPPSGRASTHWCTTLAPKNAALLAERERLQHELDAWHRAHPGPIGEPCAPTAPSSRRSATWCRCPRRCARPPRTWTPSSRCQAGPQLVVPITNARYALNAANARWGSLYDALYGTDALPETGGAARGSGYNPVRGAKVIEYARHVLDRTAPLKTGSHIDSTAYRVEERPPARAPEERQHAAAWPSPAQFVGYQGDAGAPSSVLLVHHGLHLDLRIDRGTPIGAGDAGRRGRPGARSGAVDDPRPRGLGRGGRRRRQGAGLCQLARHPQRHADRAGDQGRQDLHPRASIRTAATPPPPAEARSCCTAARCSSCATSAT